MPRPRSQTAQEVANKRVNDSLTPILEQIAADRAAAQARAEQARAAEAARIQGFSLAAAEAMRGVGGQINQIYGDAASRQATFGKGVADGFRMAMQGNEAQANALLAQHGGAPLDSVAQQGGNAIHGLGGYIPATDLNTQGAAFGAAAAMLPQTAIGRGEQDLRDARFRWSQQDQELEDSYDSERRRIEAQRPGLLQQALQEIRENNAARAEAKRQALADQQDYELKRDAMRQNWIIALKNMGYKDAQIKIELRKLGLAESKASVSAAQTNARIRISDRNSRTQAARVKAQIERDLARLGIDDEKLAQGWADIEIRNRNSRKRGKTGGLTAKQRLEKSGVAATIAETAYSGAEADDDSPALEPIDYQTALREMYKEGVPLAIAQAALNRYYRPGERGRPRVSFQERQRRNRASRRQSQGARNAPQ